jgi:transcription antitermination factor NusG
MLTALSANANIQGSSYHDGTTVRPDLAESPSLPRLYPTDGTPLPPITPGLTVRDFRVDGAHRWRVCCTKSRAEKQFAWDMLRLGFPYFLPLILRPDSRHRPIVTPAFAGYVFICGDADVVYAARATSYVCQIIEVVDQAKLVKELENLQLAAGEDGLITGVNDIVPGVRCRVKTTGHPFENMEGFMEKNGARGFVVLRVTILGDSTPVTIERQHLEVID